VRRRYRRIFVLLLLAQWLVPAIWLGYFYTDVFMRVCWWLVNFAICGGIFAGLDFPDSPPKVLYSKGAKASENEGTADGGNPN
jgi:hypothetical protein